MRQLIKEALNEKLIEYLRKMYIGKYFTSEFSYTPQIFGAEKQYREFKIQISDIVRSTGDENRLIFFYKGASANEHTPRKFKQEMAQYYSLHDVVMMWAGPLPEDVKKMKKNVFAKKEK